MDHGEESSTIPDDSSVSVPMQRYLQDCQRCEKILVGPVEKVSCMAERMKTWDEAFTAMSNMHGPQRNGIAEEPMVGEDCSKRNA